MRHVILRCRLPVGWVLLVTIALCALWGCNGSGGPSGEGSSATSVRVVFPGQQASLETGDIPNSTSPHPRDQQTAFANLLGNLKGFYTVRLAYAQVIPTSVASLLLIVTGPGMSPIQANIDIATGRVTVNVQVGNNRLFEVRAFPAGSTIPNFIGRTTADVPANGTNVTVNMQVADLNQLSVATTGTGNGTVTSIPAGISCPSDCTELYDSGTSVTLTATPDVTSSFIGWSGPCSGAGPCTVSLTADLAVTAVFNLQSPPGPTRPPILTVAKAGNGAGTVTSSPAGITCGPTCQASFAVGTPVTLTALPAAGSALASWSDGGVNCGQASTCTVTLTADTTVTVTFTQPATQQPILTVAKTGNGAGTVSSSPPGITCGQTCQAPFPLNTPVTLIASPGADSTFVGWSGSGCSGTGPCTLALTADTTITATFTLRPTLTVTKTGSGTGTVTSSPPGITCGPTCQATFDSNTPVTLTAVADGTSTFAGWSGGDCSGTGPCTLTLTADTTITATFNPQAVPPTPILTVTKSGNGTGTVTSSPAGINCGPTCQAPFPFNTQLTLIASPGADSTFAGWSGGGCSGTGSCTLTLTTDTRVTAQFSLKPRVTLTVAKAGAGTGTVTSTPAGISCNPTCQTQTAPFPSGTQVTLTATPATGSTFAGWSGGGCTGTCTLTLNVNTTVTATFTPLVTLTVTKGGNGTGTVTSTPAGISCDPTCQAPFPSGTQVTLTAVAAPDSEFYMWSGGGCFGALTCTVSLTTNTTVTAQFTLKPRVTLTKGGNGTGTVTSTPAGISCDPTCRTQTAPFPSRTLVTLTAVAAPDSDFYMWSGPPSCSGTGPCTLTLVANTPGEDITAQFNSKPRVTLTVTKAGTGTGTVTSTSPTSTPPGISCGPDCTETYVAGTQVTLTATPDTGSTFTGWSGGGCTGTGLCTLTLNMNTTVTAIFTPLVTLTVLKEPDCGGPGTVVSDPAGISCGPTCQTQSAPFPSGRPVTLTATAATDSTFDGWSGGGCVGIEPCTLTLNSNTTVTACFFGGAQSAYVVNADDATISMYILDAATGQLRHTGYIVSGSRPTSITVEGSDHFVYVANADSNEISGYRIDAKTAALIPLVESPFPTGTTPVAVSLHPSARFLYVANADSQDVSAYAIDAKNGALTPLPGAPVAAGTHPTALAVDPSARFLYVANADSQDVSAYAIDAKNGALTPLPGAPVAAGTHPTALAVDPSARFLYVANADSQDVSAYTIDAKNGVLTPLPGAPVAAGTHPTALAVDPSGRFLYVANADSQDISAYTIDAKNGVLTPLPGAPVAAGTHPTALAVDPSGRFFYVANADSQDVTTYMIDFQTGALTAIGTVRARGKAVSIAVSAGPKSSDTRSRYAFLTYQSGTDGLDALRETVTTTPTRQPPEPQLLEEDNLTRLRPGLSNRPARQLDSRRADISGYRIEATTGALTPLRGFPLPMGEMPQAMAVEPSGRFLYVINSGSWDLMGFAIAPATGALTPLPGFPVPMGEMPQAMAVEPSGRFLYVINSGSWDLMGFAIAPATGAPTPLPGFPVPMGEMPQAMAVEPSGRFLYVVNAGSQNIVAYTINPKDGTLGASSVSPSPSSENFSAMMAEPSGRFLYAINGQSQDIWGYAIDVTSGTLLPIPGTPFPSGKNPSAMAVEPSGRFLYVVNAGSQDLTGFFIAPATGVLTPLSSFPLPMGEAPQAIAVDSSGHFLYAINRDSGDIAGYAIEATTGALTPLPGFPLLIGGRPDFLVTTGRPR